LVGRSPAQDGLMSCFSIATLPLMLKRLANVLVLLGWILGGLVAWAGFHSQDQVQGLANWMILGVAVVPVAIGHMCYYVLAGK